MFNMDGEVIGINTAIYSPSGGSIGIGFAIPSALAKAVVAELIRRARPHRASRLARRAHPGGDRRDRRKPRARQGARRAGRQRQRQRPGAERRDPAGRRDPELRRQGRSTTCGTCRGSSPRRRSTRRCRSRSGASARRPRSRSRSASSTRGPSRWPAQDRAEEQAAKDRRPASVKTLGLTLSNITPELKDKFSLADDAKGVVVVDVAKDSPAAEKGLQARRRDHGSGAGGGENAGQVTGKIDDGEESRAQIDPAAGRAPGRSALRRAAARPELRRNDGSGAATFCLPIALGIEERRSDRRGRDASARRRRPRAWRGRRRRAGRRQHRQIVGAVADGHGLRERDATLGGRSPAMSPAWSRRLRPAAAPCR